ncbi:MAG: peptidoglycan-binding protein [Propionicimonas sp.]
MAISLAMAVGVALVQPSTARAISTDAQQSFISSLVAPAQAAQRQYGVPASVAIAEAILDSAWGTTRAAKQAKNYFNTTCRATMTGAQFVKLAEAQVGKPYVLGAEVAISQSNPAKFDCSELVEWLYGRSGNRITDLAAAQYNVTRAVSLSSPQVGDLVFLRNNPARANGIGHVAVVTKKLASGDWEVIEARGRAYGVVKSTLGYWKQRKYFAGMRRYSSFLLADDSTVELSSSASAYQHGCVTITEGGTTTRYAGYTSVSNGFADRAAIIASAGKYKAARAAMGDVNDFVRELAKADRPKSSDSYATSLRELISTYALTDYDVVPLTVVLASGASGTKVTALQYLLRRAGLSVTVTGGYSSGTKAAVKKYQNSKKLDNDGEAGPITLTALAPQLKTGASGDAVRALHALLSDFGYATDSGAGFAGTTAAAVKAFQSAVGLRASGTVNANTWAKLFMAVDPAPVPTITGPAQTDATLTAVPGDWDSAVTLSYQWLRGSQAISGATGPTYQVRPGDVGKTLRVAVTGTEAPFTPITRTSAATAEVAKASFTATPAPAISGDAKVGQTLTAAVGDWSPAAASATYQWFRGKSPITKATGASYTVQAADLGAKLRVTVVGSRPGYVTGEQTSAETVEITKGDFNAPKPKLSGKAKVGKKLTVSTGTWAAVTVSFEFQWYRGTTKIKGATTASYKVAKVDKGKVLSVRITGAASGFNTAERRVASPKVG